MDRVNVKILLEADVHRRLKQRALDERKSLDQLVRELLTAGAVSAK